MASRTWKFIVGENDWLTSDKFQKTQTAHFSNYETPTNAKGIYAYKHPLLCKSNGDEKVATAVY